MTREEQIAELEAYYREKGLKNAPALAVAHADKPLARLQGNTAPILARLMAGERPKDIADSFGISRIALHSWLLEHASEEWRQIASGRYQAQLEDAAELIQSAEDQLQATKARESARIASWALERIAARTYAAKGNGTEGVSITVNVNRVDQDSAITIENGQG